MIPNPVQTRFDELSRQDATNGRDYVDFISLCGQRLMQDTLAERDALSLVARLPDVQYPQLPNPFGKYKPAYGSRRTAHRMDERRMLTVHLHGFSPEDALALGEKLAGIHGASRIEPPEDATRDAVEDALLDERHVFPDVAVLDGWSLTDFPSVRHATSVLNSRYVYVGFERTGRGESRYFDPTVTLLRTDGADSFGTMAHALAEQDGTLHLGTYETWYDLSYLAHAVPVILRRDVDGKPGTHVWRLSARAVEESRGDMTAEHLDRWYRNGDWVADKNGQPDLNTLTDLLKDEQSRLQTKQWSLRGV